MKILILGGTLFLGRHLTEAALAAGHEITLFNRGRTHPGLFPGVETLTGDRDGGLAALQGRRWDAAIDTSGYVPRLAGAAADLLAGAIGHYTFISSISVYAGFGTIGMAEDAPVGTLADESVETIDGATYGPLKALCEQSVRDRLPDRTLVIRPGLIVGPHDPTDRFTYWAWHIARGGRVLAPPDLNFHVQVIDVRDLSAWTIAMIAAGRTDDYNATGPEQPLRLGEIFERCRDVSGSDAEWVCPPAEFLQEHEVQAFAELPLWVADPGYAGFFRVDISKATAAGLTFRPLDETIAATLAWANARPADHEWKAGLSPGREAELLKALQSKNRQRSPT